MVDERGTLSVSGFFIGRFLLCECELHPPAFFHFRGFSDYVTSHLFQFYFRGRSQAEVIVEVPTARAVGPSSLFLSS